MTDTTSTPPDHRLWTVAEADAYLPALDRMFDSIEGSDRVRSALLIEGVFAVMEEDGVIVRDLRRRLVDFRARAGDGSTILLCRVGDESRIRYWHGLRDGFAGRRSLEQDPPW